MQLGFYISCLMQWPSQMYAVYLRVQMLFWSVVCVKLVCMMNGCLVQIIWTISIFLGTTLNIHCHLCVCICVCFLTHHHAPLVKVFFINRILPYYSCYLFLCNGVPNLHFPKCAISNQSTVRYPTMQYIQLPLPSISTEPAHECTFIVASF